jgi:hypothetical protein
VATSYFGSAVALLIYGDATLNIIGGTYDAPSQIKSGALIFVK